MDLKEKVLKYKHRLTVEDDEEKVKHTLKRLQSLPMTLSLLQKTGIGKIVNSFRHHPKHGSRSKKLVAAWKSLAESSSSSSSSSSASSDQEEELSDSPSSSLAPSKKPTKIGKEPTVKDKKVSTRQEENKRKLPPKEKETKIKIDKEVVAPTKEKSKRKLEKEPELEEEQEPVKRKRRKATAEGFTQDSGMSFMQILSMSDPSGQQQAPSKVGKKKEPVTNGFIKTKQASNSSTGAALDWSAGQGKISPNYRPAQKRNINEFLSALNDEPVLKQQKSKAHRSSDVDPSLFQSKRTKTKLFAGRKQVTFTTVPTLYEACMRVICDNVDAIEDTGDIPYEILKPALERATPDQLFNIDDKNPYLQEDTEELWEKHCKKKFPGCESQEGIISWRQLYQRKLAAQEERLKKLAVVISAKEKANQSPQKVAKLAEAKAPRNVRRAQAKYGTAGPKEMPKVEEVVAARRQMDSQEKNATHTHVKEGRMHRPGNNFLSISAGSSASEKKKPTKAPMMVKSLKLLASTRRRR